MDVIHLAERTAAADGLPRATAVTIGSYDGVHIGHRQVIARVRQAAASLGCASAVVTFDRHPAVVVRPESAPALLTDTDQKLELLASTGVDFTVVVHFDRERAAEAAEDFVTSVLVGTLGVRAVVVGHDFHFGHDRRGNVALLTRMGAEAGFEVVDMGLVGAGDADPAPVSSTRIRKLIAGGDVEAAAVLLGRHHQVRGTVEHGDGRGRELGFPTANVGLSQDLALPADGVYAGRYAGPDGVWRAAALSIGGRPQFYEQSGLSLLEAHLLDFKGELYGQPAKVEFVARLRDQSRFESVAALVTQIEADVARTRDVVAGAAQVGGSPAGSDVRARAG